MDRGIALAERAEAAAEHRLQPYVPTFVADWLQQRPEERYRAVDCTLVFADISGFTRMTEMLAGQGKAGAEEMAGLINSTFVPLLDRAYAYGAGLIKWGGDATVLLFHGPDHAPRACRAAAEMQKVMRGLGTRQTSRGPLRLRMTIGVSSGRSDFFLLGSPEHRELLLLGPVATAIAELEKLAEAGQIVISQATFAELVRAGERPPTVRAGAGWLLRHAPRVAPVNPVFAERDPRCLAPGVSSILREYIVADALESEHRYVTAGFVQVTGSDRLLAEQGPEAVADAIEPVIRQAQAAALENGVTFLATDVDAGGAKLMLAAGAPRRSGQDERRMVATLRAIVELRAGLPVSAGAAVGRAFTGDYGPPYRRTYSLLGDCVNLAARLMAHAPDYELLASGELVSALDGAFTTELRPPFAAKGKRIPVHPFSLGPPTAREPAQAADAPPMIGREAEVLALLDGARKAGRGAGSVIDLVGEPGMGKSRLLQELQGRTTAEVLWTSGEVYAGTRPYAPFERLIRELCGVEQDAPRERLASRLTALTRQRARDLEPWLPLVGLAAGLELAETREVRETDASLRKGRLEELTSDLLGRVLDHPTVLILNDVHLMDDASRDLIRRLAADTPERSWLLVLSRRPDCECPVEDKLVAERLELRALSDEAAAELLAQATADSPLPPERLIRLAERAAGNPLFLRELSAQLSEGGDVDALPSSVEDAIAARVDRLDPAGRRILRAAAVLGMDVEGDLLEAVLEPELERLPGGIALASLGEFVDAAGPGRWRFAHQLIREVAYEALPYRRRTDLHARTATAIQRLAGDAADAQAELLSLHCFHGARYEDAWRYSLLAAERARARYGNVEAADSYRRALAAATHLSELAATRLAGVEEALGDVCVELGEPEEAEVALRRGLARVRDQPLAAARLQLGVAKLREMCGQYRGGLQWAARAERTLSDWDGTEAGAIRAGLAVLRSRISYRLGHHDNAIAFARVAVDEGEQAGELLAVAEALECADVSAVELGRPAGAGARRALSIYEELGALGAEARVHNTLGMLAYHRGAWSEALEQYAAAEQAYTRSGLRWSAATPAANSAEILADQGRLEEAQAGLERAMLVWRSVNAASDAAFGDYQLGRIASRQGRSSEALERLRAARAHFQATGELTEVVVVDAFTAECRCFAGDYAAALELADATLERAHGLGGVAAVTPLLERVRGVALLALGRDEEAEEALRRGLDAARARNAGHEIAYALKTLTDAGLARDAAEEQSWRQELAVLSGGLGLRLA